MDDKNSRDMVFATALLSSSVGPPHTHKSGFRSLLDGTGFALDCLRFGATRRLSRKERNEAEEREDTVVGRA